MKSPDSPTRNGSYDLWFNLYKLKNCWVLTHPKIASSFMDEYASRGASTSLQYQIQFGEGFKYIQSCHASELDPSTQEPNFSNEWESLLRGEEIDKKIIFLTRNPIHKFITGLLQDIVLPQLNPSIISTPWYLESMIDEKHDPVLVDSFIREVEDGRIGDFGGQALFPDLDVLEGKYKDLYESTIKHTLDGYPKESGFKAVYDSIQDGHRTQLQLELYNFIIDPPTGFNIKAIKVVDIHKEDLQLILESLGEITPQAILNENEKKKNIHERSPILQETIRKILSEHGDIINKLILPNLYGWVNLLKIIYPTDTSDKKATVDNPIHTLEKFQSKQYLNNPFKEYSDIFNPEFYFSWMDRTYCRDSLYENTIPFEYNHKKD